MWPPPPRPDKPFRRWAYIVTGGVIVMLALFLLAEKVTALAWPVGKVLCPAGTASRTYMILDRSSLDPFSDQEMMWSIRCDATTPAATPVTPDAIAVAVLFIAFYTPPCILFAWLVSLAWRRARRPRPGAAAGSGSG